MLTGLQQDDIRNLAKTNVLPSHRNRRGHYRFNVDAVEKYFGIVIDNIEQKAEPSALTENTSKESQDVDKVKYISGHTARKYLKCSKAEFESLIEQGIIKAHRDEYNRWKVSKESVINYSKCSLPSNDTRLIINENHYQEIIERICAAKSSVKIMTANFKRFRSSYLFNAFIIIQRRMERVLSADESRTVRVYVLREESCKSRDSR